MLSNMRKIITLSLLLGGMSLAQAQSIERSVIGTAGESVSNSSAQLDITVGEIVTLTSTSTSTSHVTQGFNQPIVATGNVSITKTELEALQIVAYPNPASDILNVRTAKPLTSATSYSILNQLGQIISTGTLSPLNTSIGISELASSTYILVIQNEDLSLRKSIRFTKN
jgi:hypothetical protein